MEAPGLSLEVFLQFKLTDRIYLLSLRDIDQVIDVPGIYELPGAHSNILGLINYNSKIVPVVSINTRLHLRGTAVTKKSKVLIVTYKNELVGILVDEIIKSIALDADRIKELKTQNQSFSSSFLELENIL